MNSGNIRPVQETDCKALTEIYNHYILNSTASFETEALREEQMLGRIREISSRFPYYIYEEQGRVLGYCYAHPWKSRAAYALTLETTVYIHKEACRKGIGTMLMYRLIENCRELGYKSLIACITGENSASIEMHGRLGFKQVSFFKEVGNKFGRFLDVVDMELLLQPGDEAEENSIDSKN